MNGGRPCDKNPKSNKPADLWREYLNHSFCSVLESNSLRWPVNTNHRFFCLSNVANLNLWTKPMETPVFLNLSHNNNKSSDGLLHVFISKKRLFSSKNLKFAKQLTVCGMRFSKIVFRIMYDYVPCVLNVTEVHLICVFDILCYQTALNLENVLQITVRWLNLQT